MNRRITIACVLALSAVVSMSAQDDDDLYFTPSRKNVRNEAVSPAAMQPGSVTYITTEKPKIEVYNNNSRNDNEYNRRDKDQSLAWQSSGGYDGESAYDTSEVVSRYDLNDPELDYTYSRRLLRFHSPSIGVAISSPYYWDLVYGYGVYDYFYDPFYYDFYDPFYWNYGWGYGYSWGPWSTWYGPLWGWHSPYHWAYWGIGPTWHRTSLTPGGEHPARINNNRIAVGRNDRINGRVRTNALASNIASRNGRTSVSLARTTPRTSVRSDLQERTGGAIDARTVQRRESGRALRPSSTRTTVVRPNTGTEQSTPRTTTPSRTTVTERTTTPSRTTVAPARQSAPASRPSASMSAPRSGGGFGGGMSGGSRGGMSGGSRGGGRR